MIAEIIERGLDSYDSHEHGERDTYMRFMWAMRDSWYSNDRRREIEIESQMRDACEYAARGGMTSVSWGSKPTAFEFDVE